MSLHQKLFVSTLISRQQDSTMEVVLMNKEEVIERLKKDLDLPNFKGRLEEKEYSEEEYQKIKNDLNDYFENYVRNIEN